LSSERAQRALVDIPSASSWRICLKPGRFHETPPGVWVHPDMMSVLSMMAGLSARASSMD
jgi:hypothetical protein